MSIEIDQSVKIEQTNRDTIIAFSNKITYSVVVSAKIKKQIKQQFRESKSPNLFRYRTFAAGIALLLKNHDKELDVVIIDKEYSGRERLIKNMIEEMLEKLNCKIPEIYFKEIGRKSNAHNIAYFTMKGKYKPNKILDLEELQRLIFRVK